MARIDVLVVSVASTTGWRAAAEELVDALGRCGVRTEMVRTGPQPRVRTFALTEFVEAHTDLAQQLLPARTAGSEKYVGRVHARSVDERAGAAYSR